MIKNIFLDANEVILNELKAENYSVEIITQIIRRYKNYSIENYWKDVEEAVYRFALAVNNYVLYKNISDIKEYYIVKREYMTKVSKYLYETPFELSNGIKEFLIEFSKNHRIGILGEYGSDLTKFLKNKDLLKYFAYNKIRGRYDVLPFDARYYERILRNCKCKAEESIMIGNTIVRDILPAKVVRMKTIRIKTGTHKNQEPRTPEEMPDITVNNLDEIKIETIKELG